MTMRRISTAGRRSSRIALALSGWFAVAPAGAAAGALGQNAPVAVPDLERARILYGDACADCHGDRGRGDGRRAPELEPPPRSFQDPEVMATVSPARAYAAITEGIDDTAMASFELLPREERFGLAFYAVALRHDEEAARRGARALRAGGAPVPPSLGELARRTDAELLDALADLPPEQRADALAFLRRYPERHVAQAPLGTARARLAEALAAARTGDRTRARRKAAAAHRRGFEAVSPLLDAAARRDVEARLVGFRRALGGGEVPEALADRGRRLVAAIDAHAKIPAPGAVAIAAGGRAGAAAVPLAILAALAGGVLAARRAGRRPGARTLVGAVALGALAAAALWREFSLLPAFAEMVAGAGATGPALAGAGAALAAVGIAAALARGIAPRHPAARAISLAILAAMLAGNAARELQVALALEPASAPLPPLPWLGVHPAWEPLLVQAGVWLGALARARRRASKGPSPS